MVLELEVFGCLLDQFNGFEDASPLCESFLIQSEKGPEDLHFEYFDRDLQYHSRTLQ